MKKHFVYYISLIAGIVFAIFLAILFQADLPVEMGIVVGVACFYVVWGIVHHRVHHSLRAKIVLEYVAVACLGVATILFLIKSTL